MTAAFVQAAPDAPGTGSGNTAGDSYSQAFDSANTAGNCLVAAISFDTTNVDSVDHIDDTLENTWELAKHVQDPAGETTEVWIAKNCAAGENTVTVHWAENCAGRNVAVAEYSGIDTSDPIDVVAGQVASGTNATDDVTSGTAETTVDGCLIFGALEQYRASAVNAGTGFTQRTHYLNGGISELSIQDMVQESAGDVASTNTAGVNTSYISIMVALKPAANEAAVTGELGLNFVMTGSSEKDGQADGELSLDLSISGDVSEDEVHVATGELGVDLDLHDDAVKESRSSNSVGLGLELVATASKVVEVTGTLQLGLQMRETSQSTNEDIAIVAGPPVGSWSAEPATSGGWTAGSPAGSGWIGTVAGGDWAVGAPTA